MRFTLEIELGNVVKTEVDVAEILRGIACEILAHGMQETPPIAIYSSSYWRESADGTASEIVANLIGQWEIVSDVQPAAPTVTAPPSFVCCCGATSTPAPTMPAVLAMPTAAELAAWQQLGAMAAPGADELHRAAVASMASVAGMAGLPTAGAGALSGSGVAAESPRENIADRITPTGSIAAAAGPTGSPRRRNLASRPTQSQIVADLVLETRTNGRAAARKSFEDICSRWNLNAVEAAGIVGRVRASVDKLEGIKD